MKTQMFAVVASCALVLLSQGQSEAAIEVGHTIKLIDRPGTPGGVFEVDSTTNSWQNFLTFCVEVHEHINFTNTYVVNSIGLSTDASNASKNKSLTSKAAWLYTSFLDGSLGSGYDGSDISDLSNISLITANKLQLAIWIAMGYTSSDISTSINALWYDMYNDETLFQAWTDAFEGDTDWSGTGDVHILNLETLSGGYAQDQLVVLPSPPPEPGSGGEHAPEPVSFLVWSVLAACVGVMSGRSRYASN